MEIVFYLRGLFPFEKSLGGRVFDIRSKGHKGAFNTERQENKSYEERQQNA